MSPIEQHVHTKKISFLTSGIVSLLFEQLLIFVRKFGTKMFCLQNESMDVYATKLDWWEMYVFHQLFLLIVFRF